MSVSADAASITIPAPLWYAGSHDVLVFMLCKSKKTTSGFTLNHVMRHTRSSYRCVQVKYLRMILKRAKRLSRCRLFEFDDDANHFVWRCMATTRPARVQSAQKEGGYLCGSTARAIQTPQVRMSSSSAASLPQPRRRTQLDAVYKLFILFSCQIHLGRRKDPWLTATRASVGVI